MANVTSSFTDGTASDAVQSLYNTLLLRRAVPMLIHRMGVKLYPLSRRSGKTMIWRRLEELPEATTPLIEGVNPDGVSKTKTDVSATIAAFGSYIEDSELLLSTQPEPHAVENVELLGEQMGRTFDSLYRDLMDDATNETFANGTALNEVTEPVDRNDLDRAYRDLMNRDSIKFTPMIMASQNIGTGPIMPAYWAMCHEDVAFDLRHLDGFHLISEYGHEGGILLGEFGSDKNGLRFLSSSKAKVNPDAGGATTNVKSTGGSNADVYSIFIVGRDALGAVHLAGQGDSIIKHAPGTSGVADPLNWRGTIGWRKYDARAVLNQAFLQEILCAASK